MADPYTAILSNHDVKQALTLAADADDEQLRLAAYALGDRQFEKLCEIAQNKLSVAHTLHTLQIGGLLRLCRIAAEVSGRPGAFAQLREELGIKQTKAYDDMSVFRSFGEPLLKNAHLIPLMPVAGLKLLSRKDVPPEARETALKIAQAGERVTIRRANELLESHGCLTPSAKRKPQRSRDKAEPFWSFDGSAVRLTLVAADPQHVPGISVLHDLEAAIAASRDQNFGEGSTPDAA